MLAGLDGKVGGGGDHGAVVGTVLRLGEVDLVCFRKGFGELVAEELVGRDATGQDDAFGGVGFGGFAELLDKDVDGGVLEAGSKVGDLLRGKFCGEFVGWSSDGEVEVFLDCAKDGGFEAAE